MINWISLVFIILMPPLITIGLVEYGATGQFAALVGLSYVWLHWLAWPVLRNKD